MGRTVKNSNGGSNQTDERLGSSSSRSSQMGRTVKNSNGGSNQTDERLGPSSSRSSAELLRIPQSLSPREKVLKALRLFRIIFDELKRDKAAHLKPATSKIELETMRIVKKAGKHVNAEKMMGKVPGVEVGDGFQYKAELSLIGLHFSIHGGIDYMESTGHLKLATSIVASEGSGYSDQFESPDVLIYSGEGGTLTEKGLEDQKLIKGNLALANCVKNKSYVRVIRGLKRAEKRGKNFVYYGLYVVQEYWPEKDRAVMLFSSTNFLGLLVNLLFGNISKVISNNNYNTE